MKNSLSRTLRQNPDLDQLRRQARELMNAFIAGDPNATAEVHAHYRDADRAAFALHHAQLVLARAYGFESWPKLRACVQGVTAGRLCEAVERGDISAVRDMLRRRPEIVNFEWPAHGEQRALHVAVLRRDAPMVRLLMQSGADARRGIYPNRDATSALTIAIERGYDDIVAIIQEEEARRGARGKEEDIAELMACGDEAQIIAAFEADPALVVATHPEGWTALHYAAGRLLERVVRWLREHGADVNRRAAGGWTPLEFAASARAWDRTGTPERFTALATVLLRAGAELTSISAVALGDVDWVRAHHAAGLLTNANSVDTFGPSGALLRTAVQHDRPEMLALLLDLGVDPDEPVRVEGTEDVVYSSGSPLYACARLSRLRMAEMLLQRGADPNASVYASGSPVFAAYGAGDQDMIALLERYGGALDATEVGYVRQTELAKKMLAGEVDARLERGTFSGETVAEQLLWSGASGGDTEIVRVTLEQVGWPRDDPRWFRMLWRPLPGHSPRPESERAMYLACFRLILDRCDPNLRDRRFGQTMLHEVIARDHGEGVAFATALLDAGARLDIRDNLLRSTALGWSCRWGRVDLVRLLLERGADPVEADAEVWATPRAWAEKKGHTDVLALLHEPRG